LILVNQALGIEPKMGLKTKVFEILGNKVEWECNKMGVFQWTRNVFKCSRQVRLTKNMSWYQLGWVKHEFVVTHTLKKKEQEACASDVQIQVVCASWMLCVSCVGAIDNCGGGF
jgi:hypothetical protein